MKALTLAVNNTTTSDFINCLKEIFEGHEFGYLNKDGDVWFVAKDVCKILGIKNVTDAISRLKSTEKDDLVLTDIVGKKNKHLIISESGLYKLIAKSRKPEAEKFIDFITEKVLPEIRKTGRYLSENQRITEIRSLFVREMPSAWEKLFPLELFERFCDLKGWSYKKGVSSYTNAMRHLISKYIYGVIPCEVMTYIYQQNYGKASKLHQWMTEDMAKEIVKTQITKVLTLLNASNSWNTFEVLFNRCNYGQQPLLPAERL